jgi:Spy/CpxP family protein refolding chaperone
MKKKILAATAIALVGLATFALVDLFAFDGPRGGGKWWYRPAVKDKLELTDEQVRRINKIWIAHRKRLIDLKGEVQKAYLDLEDLMAQPSLDKNQASSLAEKLGQLQAKQTEERIRMAVAIRTELSLDQYEKLRALKRALAKMPRERIKAGGERRESLRLN